MAMMKLKPAVLDLDDDDPASFETDNDEDSMLDASEGRVDEAVATLGTLVETPLTDTLKQQASLSLARVYRDAGQLSDAKAAYETFLSAYPESVQKDTVEAEMNALASEGPAEGDNEPVVSPTENPAPEEVPDPPIEEATEPEETTEPPAGEGSPE